MENHLPDACISQSTSWTLAAAGLTWPSTIARRTVENGLATVLFVLLAIGVRGQIQAPAGPARGGELVFGPELGRSWAVKRPLAELLAG